MLYFTPEQKFHRDENGFEFEIIATGSSGNAVRVNDVLFDCGVPFSVIQPHLGLINYIVITHKHADHYLPTTLNRIKTEKPLIQILVNQEIDIAGLTFSPFPLYPGKYWKLGDTLLRVYPLYHDVPNIAFIGDWKGTKYFYATDTAEVKHIRAKGLHYYFQELNHDEDFLEETILRSLTETGYSHEIKAKDNHLSFQRSVEYFLSQRNSRSKLIPLHMNSVSIEMVVPFLDHNLPDK